MGKSGNIIGIGGGVGPMAGVKLHEKIIENTLTNGTDQDHLDVYHFSRSHNIPDRTEYLLGKVEKTRLMECSGQRWLWSKQQESLTGKLFLACPAILFMPRKFLIVFFYC